jgi:hypothetical protein
MSRKAMSTHSLIHYLADIADPRHAKGIRHPQLSTLTIMVRAMLCGTTSLKGIARFARTHVEVLAQYIPLPRNKPPSFSTVQRLSHHVDCEQVCEQFNRWMDQYTDSETLAIDGKSITSTVTETLEGKQTFTSLVSFFGQRSHLIRQVGKLENDQRSEIDLVQELIGQLHIERSVFTLDALHCQKKRWPRLLSKATATSLPSSRTSPRCMRRSPV